MSRMNRALRALTVALSLSACVGDIGGSDGKQPTDPASAGVSASALERLTRIEYERTVTAVFGEDMVATVHFGDLPADGKIGRFESNVDLNVNIDSIDAYRSIAEEIGEAAAPKAASLMGCAESDACVEGFIRDYGLLLYRRPLTDEQITLYRALWSATRAEGTLGDAVRLTITAMLQAPDFLYRLENGQPGDDDDLRLLDGYELASRLSFFLWKSGPDKALLAAAESGELDTDVGLEAEARRLLADERADYTILRFHSAWLGIDVLETQLVDATAFPEFEALRGDMQAETEQFILHLFRNDDARIEKLFSADYSFASPALASFYGDGVTSVGADGRLALDPKQRMGVLTQASFLTAHARTPSRAAIYRGKSILVDVLCKQLVLPEDVNTAIDFDPTEPARQQIEQATSSAGCKGCHAMINPLGFLFENYDGIGKWRTMEGEHPIDASGEVTGTDVDGKLVGATALAEKLAESDEVAQCLSRQWLRFALSRQDTALDNESVELASDAAEGDMRELMVALTLSDAFRNRRLTP